MEDAFKVLEAAGIEWGIAKYGDRFECHLSGKMSAKDISEKLSQEDFFQYPTIDAGGNTALEAVCNAFKDFMRGICSIYYPELEERKDER